MAEQTPEMKVRDYWDEEIKAAEKRCKEFWPSGEKIVKRFKAWDQKKDSPDQRLNLFHSNVSTTLAMLYGRVPEVDVSRRYADSEDDVARVAAELLRRILGSNIQEVGSDVKNVLLAALKDRLLPGLGTARIRYDFTTKSESAEEVVVSDDGEEKTETVEYEVLEAEDAIVEYVFWKDVLWGYGHTWSEVPWVAFRSYLTKPEATARFGAEVAGKLAYSFRNVSEDKDEQTAYTWDRACIYEIWCKNDRKVRWFSKDMDVILDTQDDPLHFHKFFPMPEPMAANVTTDVWMPTADFKMAQDLYNDIDVLTTRINVLTKACKVIGVYAGKEQEVRRIFQEGVENDLIPVDSWAAFAEKGGLKGVIDWVPIDVIADVILKLRELRQENIELLYQITGMADILRGHSDEYSAASSDKLKAKFASIRVQQLQDEFARFASDLMALRAECIRKHYELDSLLEQSNAAYMPEEPQLVMQAAEFLLNDDPSFMWRVEIKPESIALIDYAQLREERTEYLTALATFMQSSAAITSEHPEAASVLLELLKWGLAGFKGSQQIEGVIDRAIKSIEEAAKNPQPPPPNPKLEEIEKKSQAEILKLNLKAQHDFNAMQQEHFTKMQEIMAESDADERLEKMQAYYNILEANVKAANDRVKEQMKARKTA